MINPWVEASRWATLYPMLTATTGLTLACGAAFLRWGHPVFGAIGALSAGLALGIDFRGLAMVALMVVALILLAWSRHRRPGIALLALALLVVGPALNQTKAVSHQKTTDTATQRALEVRLALESGDIDLVRACRSELTDEVLGFPSLRCAQQTVRVGLRSRQPGSLQGPSPFGVGLTLLSRSRSSCSATVGGWRASLSSLLVFGAGWGALFLMVVWARLNVHHFVQFAVPIAMVVPVALSRTIRTLTFRRAQGTVQALTMLGASAWLWAAGPWAGKPVDDLAQAETHQLLGWMLSGVDMHVDLDGGDQLLDCSGPRRGRAPAWARLNRACLNFQTSATAERCTQWIHSPWRLPADRADHAPGAGLAGPPVPPG